MSKDPAVLFYTSDFLTGTSLMTYEEKGQYIHLLCLQHQMGHLSKADLDSVTKSARVLEKFVLTHDGAYHNVRMHEEKLKRIAYCKSRMENLSIRKKKKRVSHMERHMDSHMENENDNINTDMDTDTDMDMDTITNQDVKNKNNLYINNSLPITPLGYFYHKYKQATGEECFKSRKDKDIFMELGAIEPAKLIRLIDKFFESTDEFIKKAGFTPGVFKSQINKLMGQAPLKMTAKEFLEGK